MSEELDAVVVGGGFGGLLCGGQLKAAGLTSVRLVERGGQLGGTWY
jgi:cyclohexanone monooxygenase